MKQETYISISTTQMIAFVLWVATVTLLAAAWIVVLMDYDSRRFGYLLALTSCVLAAVAAVVHIRMFLLRITGLIRVTSGLVPPADETPTGIRSIPRAH